MNMQHYQERASETAIYPPEIGLVYCVLGLVGESGEIANKVKKIYRDHNGVISTEARTQLIEECGDVMWYLAQLLTEMACPMDDCATLNLEKLHGRKTRGALTGSGDSR